MRARRAVNGRRRSRFNLHRSHRPIHNASANYRRQQAHSTSNALASALNAGGCRMHISAPPHSSPTSDLDHKSGHARCQETAHRTRGSAFPVNCLDSSRSARVHWSQPDLANGGYWYALPHSCGLVLFVPAALIHGVVDICPRRGRTKHTGLSSSPDCGVSVRGTLRHSFGRS